MWCVFFGHLHLGESLCAEQSSTYFCCSFSVWEEGLGDMSRQRGKNIFGHCFWISVSE